MIGSLFKKRESTYNSSSNSSGNISSSIPSHYFNSNNSHHNYNNNNNNNNNTNTVSKNDLKNQNLSYSTSSTSYNPNHQQSISSFNIDLRNPLTSSHNINSNSNSNSNLSSGYNNFNNNNLLNNDANKINPQDSGLAMPCLYGINTSTPNPTFKLSEKLQGFRMVIIQDAGIRKKQPLFDSAVSYNKNFSIMQQKLNKKIYHSINELSLFMFGCYGMPISENNMTTKIHYLPTLSNMHSSVLITRLFSLDSSFKLKIHKISKDTSDWDPHPLLESDELPLYENTSIRFSIGIIVPVSQSIESVRDEITENWLQTSDSLLQLQNLIVSKLKLIYNLQNLSKKNNQQVLNSNLINTNTNSNINTHNNNTSSNSFNFGFSLYSLQTEIEIHRKLTSFLTQLISLSEVPRLFIDLKHSNQSIIDWASTLSLWLELKDGKTPKYYSSDLNYNNIYNSNSNNSNNNTISNHNNSNHSIKFLASLLTIFLPIRDELFIEPEKSNTELNKLRIVIGTGNPAISQKLVFILVGILGYDKFSDLYEAAQKLPKNKHQNNIRETKTVPIPISKPETDYSKRNILTRNNSLILENSNYSQVVEPNFSSLRVQHSPSISTVSANVHSQRIPVPMLTRTSSYASLQNLSTSYGANIPTMGSSHTPSSSWRNNIGSFMDRWKNSITSSPTTSQISKSPRTETPSPNLVDYDDYPWQINVNKRPTSNASPAPSFVSLNGFSNLQISGSRLSIKNQIVGNYISTDIYKLSRSTINLIPSRFDNIIDNIKLEINSIMNGDFETYETDSENESVVDVSMKLPKDEDEKIKNINPITAIPLPLLVGYISQFRPEFGMMCCPNKSLNYDVFTQTLKDDLQNPLVDNSNIYFINLGMRRVNLLESKKKSSEKIKSNKNLKDDNIPIYLSKPSISNLSNRIMENEFEKRIQNSKPIQSNFELHEITIFAPEKPLNYGVIDGISNINETSDKVELLDRILEKIALTVNNFLSEVKGNPDDDANAEKECECCDNIRELIERLLEIGDST